MLEFLFEVLFEIFGEVFGQVIFQALAEAGLHFFRRPGAKTEETGWWKLVIGYTLLGVVIGVISLFVFPHALMHGRVARIGYLVLAPIATGLSMSVIGALRQRRGQDTIPLDRFAYGWLLGFATALVRYLGTD